MWRRRVEPARRRGCREPTLKNDADRPRPEAKRRTDVLAAMEQRGSGEWLQDEVFLIFLLIDAFVPDWRRTAFRAPPSPVRMLENALHGDVSGDEAESG